MANPTDPTKFSSFGDPKAQTNSDLLDNPTFKQWGENREIKKQYGPNAHLDPDGNITKYFSSPSAQTGFGASFTPGSYAANPMQTTPSLGAPFGGGFKDLQGSSLGAQAPTPGLLDTAKSMASGAYHSVVDPIVNKVTEIKDSFGGVEDSIKGLQNTRNQLQTSMVNNPQNVTQDTYNSLATADRQIARATGANLPQGVPATGSIENAPVPQGMPAPVPLSDLPGAKSAAAPAAPKQFQMPSAEEMAAFRKQTGTAFNAKSINDKLSIERMRGNEETFDSKQANAYRAAHKDYRPGMYTKG